MMSTRNLCLYCIDLSMDQNRNKRFFMKNYIEVQKSNIPGWCPTCAHNAGAFKLKKRLHCWNTTLGSSTFNARNLLLPNISVYKIENYPIGWWRSIMDRDSIRGSTLIYGNDLSMYNQDGSDPRSEWHCHLRYTFGARNFFKRIQISFFKPRIHFRWTSRSLHLQHTKWMRRKWTESKTYFYFFQAWFLWKTSLQQNIPRLVKILSLTFKTGPWTRYCNRWVGPLPMHLQYMFINSCDGAIVSSLCAALILPVARTWFSWNIDIYV